MPWRKLPACVCRDESKGKQDAYPTPARGPHNTGETNMNIRVVTLRYNESLGGFPEEPLRQVLAGANVVEEREYFFVHGGVPHLTLVLVLDSSPTGRPSGEAYARNREDPGDKLPEHLQALYRSLREWRNDRAKRVGVPSTSSCAMSSWPRSAGTRGDHAVAGAEG